jgi:hypothetical protein
VVEPLVGDRVERLSGSPLVGDFLGRLRQLRPPTIRL